jgi:phosphatidylserine/phosphatidylglycerophosphate/cardiolipin synthase-like enzyme
MAQQAIARNKAMIIDGETVITGSFNLTRAAEENNAGNLAIIHDRLLIEKGGFTKKELLEKVRVVHKEMKKRKGGN